MSFPDESRAEAMSQPYLADGSPNPYLALDPVQARKYLAAEPEDFPPGYRGAGPMYAAVDAGEPAWRLAAAGADTYMVELPGGGVAGDAAFLDRGQAEQVADAGGTGEVTHWHGLVGRTVLTPAREAAERQADAEAWGGRGPSASYAEWAAEGTGPEAG